MFLRISSLLLGSFVKETYNFEEPTNRSHPISCFYLTNDIRWLRLVGSFKLQVSFAEYRLFCRALLQKRPIIMRSLLVVATPKNTHDSPHKLLSRQHMDSTYQKWFMYICVCVHTPPLSFSFFLSLSLPLVTSLYSPRARTLSLSLSLTHMNIHADGIVHTHIRTHRHTLSLPLSPSLFLSLPFSNLL